MRTKLAFLIVMVFAGAWVYHTERQHSAQHVPGPTGDLDRDASDLMALLSSYQEAGLETAELGENAPAFNANETAPIGTANTDAFEALMDLGAPSNDEFAPIQSLDSVAQQGAEFQEEVLLAQVSTDELVEDQRFEDVSHEEAVRQPVELAQIETGQAAILRPVWRAGEKTSTGRRFEIATVGMGEKPIAVIGSLYGDEGRSRFVMDRLLVALRQEASLMNEFKILLVRTGNPDGVALGTQENANGQLLDQHFNSSSKQPQPVEVAYLTRLLEQHRPQRVIHLRSTWEQRGMMQFPSRDEAMGALLAATSNYRILPPKAPQSGSLGHYVVTKLDAQMGTLYVPVGSLITEVWEQNQSIVTQSLRSFQRSEPIPDVDLSENQVGPVANRAAPVDIEFELEDAVPFASSEPLELGFEPADVEPEVELLPPPEENIALEGFDWNGYIELPPPPSR